MSLPFFGVFPIYRNLLLVQFFPQLAVTFECHHLPGSQHHILSRGRIPAFALLFIFHAEITKAENHHIIAGFQRLFDELQQYFHCFNRLFTSEPVSLCHCIDDVGFGEGAGLWH